MAMRLLLLLLLVVVNKTAAVPWGGNPVLYIYDFTSTCKVRVYEVTPQSCTDVLDDTVGGNIYTPRAIQGGLYAGSGASVLETDDPILATATDPVDDTWAACVVYSSPPLYAFVSIDALVNAPGTVLIGVSKSVGSPWCNGPDV